MAAYYRTLFEEIEQNQFAIDYVPFIPGQMLLANCIFLSGGSLIQVFQKVEE